MRVIPPQGLPADAIVPQCLDNQYTSDVVLDELLSGSKTYADQAIASMRYYTTHVEFLRSLLYSSAVVVNEAYFVNSHYLIDQLSQQDTAIPELMRGEAIIPFIQSGESLGKSGTFTRTQQGRDALQRLEDSGALDNCQCVRFSADEEENKRSLEELGMNFQSFVRSAGDLPERDEFQRVARGLYHAASIGDSLAPYEVPVEVIEEFSKDLRGMNSFVDEVKNRVAASGGKGQLGRQHLYERYFIRDGEATPSNVQNGIFAESMKRPARRMLKKLFDLKYNANLPDALDRFTLTPSDLPGRSVLPYHKGKSKQSLDELLDQLRDLKSTIMDTRPEILPRLGTLGLKDAVEIRSFDEWQRFRTVQEKLLNAQSLTALPVILPEYYDGLEAFQRHLFQWGFKKSPAAVHEKATCQRIVSILIQAGEFSFRLLVPEIMRDQVTGPVAQMAALGAGALGADKLVEFLGHNKITEEVKGFSVKLLWEMWNLTSGEINKEHSMQLELIRNEKKIRVNHLIEMIQDLERSSKVNLAANSRLSEQAKE